MKKLICTKTSIQKTLKEFFDSEKININISTEPTGDIEVVKCDDSKESTLAVIYSGGCITCEIARSIAKKMNISLSQTGKLMNHLDVKIRRCSLGCFK